MKLYVWEDVNTGAYHQDGVITILAPSLEAARRTAEDLDTPRRRQGKHWKTGKKFYYNDDPSYKYGEHCREHEPTRVLGVGTQTAKVVVSYSGCDC